MRISRFPARASALLACAAIVASATTAFAQKTNGYLRIAARDSSGAPVSDAEFTVTQGLHDVVAHGTTDERGLGFAAYPASDSVDLQVTLRKIGFARTDRFFEGVPSDTVALSLVAARSDATSLDAVKVSAQRDLKAAKYNIDADQIAAAKVPLFDGWDVVKKLRPDMLTSLGGCPTGIRNVWVNGKRIVLPLPATGIAADRARVGVRPDARYTYAAVSVLTEIPPEHIQQLIYKDCFDHSMAVVGSQNALFIVLKPGIAFERNVGSFVDDSIASP